MLTASEIAHALGGATRNGRGWLARCCCHEDQRPSLSLCDGDEGKLLVKCFAGCDARDILTELRGRSWLDDRARDRSSPPKPPPRRAARTNFAASIWREAIDPNGALAETYLRSRGLALDDDLAMRVLRFHGHCPFGKDKSDKAIFVPALVVAFRPTRGDDETRPPLAIHRIGLKPGRQQARKKDARAGRRLRGQARCR